MNTNTDPSGPPSSQAHSLLRGIIIYSGGTLHAGEEHPPETRQQSTWLVGCTKINSSNNSSSISGVCRKPNLRKIPSVHRNEHNEKSKRNFRNSILSSTSSATSYNAVARTHAHTHTYRRAKGKKPLSTHSLTGFYLRAVRASVSS